MQRDELLYRTRCRCYNPQHIESLPGLVHHSDRGSQYASSHYTDLLKENGIDISMSRKANPWDNAACESFMKTLKVRRGPPQRIPGSGGRKRDCNRKCVNGRAKTDQSESTKSDLS